MKSDSFIQLDPHNYSPSLRGLFDQLQPATLRCFAVLDGVATGKVLMDNPDNPRWAVVQEAGFGTIYPGGDLPAAILNQLIADLRRQGEVLIGLWPDDLAANNRRRERNMRAGCWSSPSTTRSHSSRIWPRISAGG